VETLPFLARPLASASSWDRKPRENELAEPLPAGDNQRRVTDQTFESVVERRLPAVLAGI
jgi:hypothetical protein